MSDLKRINKLYNTTDLITHKINGILIPLDPEWKKLLINLSGGADSALLAFTVCKIIEENQYSCTVDVLSYIRMWKTKPWQSVVSLNVFNWLKDRFPNIIGDRHTHFIPPELEHGTIGNINKTGLPGNSIIGFSYSRYLQNKNNYGAIYNATTKNPSGTDHPWRIADRDDPEFNIDTLISYEDKSGWLFAPFRLIEKDWVVQQYVEEDIVDLFHTTRSCEMEYDKITVETYTKGQHVPECGKCFWCSERNWAKEKAGINDR